MTADTIAVLGTGDMGHAVGRSLREHGHDVLTCLEGRGERSRGLAREAGLREVPDMETLVSEAALVISILPPANALAAAAATASAMAIRNVKPHFADCNAIAPATSAQVGARIAEVGASYIDGGIIGNAPGKAAPPRFYVSGPDTAPMQALDGKGIVVKPLGPEIGRASAMKMCYAAATKGTFSLHAAVLTAARSLGMYEYLIDEFADSQQAMLKQMENLVPRLPADADRWAGEMDEIAATFEGAGVTPDFHRGAAWILRLIAGTPFAAETRETMDPNRTLEDRVRVYAAHLDKTA